MAGASVLSLGAYSVNLEYSRTWRTAEGTSAMSHTRLSSIAGTVVTI